MKAHNYKTAEVKVEDWKVQLVNDDDGHLTLYVTHDGEAMPYDVDADIAGPGEYAVKLTTILVEADANDLEFEKI